MCPCCKFCRCCKKEREEVAKPFAALYVGLLVVFLIGILSGFIVALGGSGYLIVGWDAVQCTLTTLLGRVVSGTDSAWPTEKVNDLVSILDETNPFMVKTKQILLDTEPLERSVLMLTASMDLLDDMMASESNLRPKANSGADLDHLCILCQGIAGNIKPVSTKISDSLGKALEEARGQVNEKLSGKELKDIQKSLRDGLDPMNEVRDTVMDSVGKTMIKDNLFKDVEDILGLIATVVILVSLLAFLPLTCTCCAAGITITKPKKNNRFCACCGWCCGVLYVCLPLLLGAIFSATSVPIAQVCLVLDDLNGQTFDQWAPAFGVKKEEAKTPEDWQNTLNVVDACTNRESDGRIMNVITVADGKEEGKRISVGDKLRQETRGRINEKFDEMIAKQNEQESISGNKDFQDMMTLLAMPVDGLTAFDPDKVETLTADPRFRGFAMTQQPEIAKKAFTTSASCMDNVVDANGPLKNTALAGKSVPGINSLRNDLEKVGMSGSCGGSDCTCSMSGGPADPTGGGSDLSTAANAIFQIKKDLRSSTQYRCDLFQDEQGRSCDPKDFVRGGLAPDCVQRMKDGKLALGKDQRKKITCGYAQFVQYIADFKTRLEVATKYLEDETNEFLPAIGTELKAHIDTGLLDPILQVVDGVSCSIVKNTFHGLVDGVCFHMARGIIDVGEGFKTLGMFVVIMNCLAYFFWRRNSDNINLQKYKVASGGDAPMEGARAGGDAPKAPV